LENKEEGEKLKTFSKKEKNNIIDDMRKEKEKKKNNQEKVFDVAIIDGAFAGLSAAYYLVGILDLR
jgi:stress-induced morphogen